jgi:hypothetical protein
LKIKLNSCQPQRSLEIEAAIDEFNLDIQMSHQPPSLDPSHFL